MFMLRHNSLRPPFNSYEHLSLEMLDDLAMNRISPDIGEIPEILPIRPEILDRLKNVDYCVCSTAERTRQTCRAIMQSLGINKKIIVDSALNEIVFCPSEMTDSPDDNPLITVRKKLYSNIAVNGTGVETRESVLNRIGYVLTEYGGKNVAVFSHGFFMRLVHSYINNGHDIGSALEHIAESPFIDYLGVVDVGL